MATAAMEDTRPGVMEESLNFFFESIPLSSFPAPPLGHVITLNSDMLLQDAVSPKPALAADASCPVVCDTKYPGMCF